MLQLGFLRNRYDSRETQVRERKPRVSPRDSGGIRDELLSTNQRKGNLSEIQIDRVRKREREREKYVIYGVLSSMYISEHTVSINKEKCKLMGNVTA